jgi:hypothetical protein
MCVLVAEHPGLAVDSMEHFDPRRVVGRMADQLRITFDFSPTDYAFRTATLTTSDGTRWAIMEDSEGLILRCREGHAISILPETSSTVRLVVRG